MILMILLGLFVLIFLIVIVSVHGETIVVPKWKPTLIIDETNTTSSQSWEDMPAEDILPGRLKRVYPGEYLGHSLKEIKEKLKSAKGSEKKVLQKAKKILEQQERLSEKSKGGGK